MFKKLFVIVLFLSILAGCTACSIWADEPTVISTSNDTLLGDTSDTGEKDIDVPTTEQQTIKYDETEPSQETLPTAKETTSILPLPIDPTTAETTEVTVSTESPTTEPLITAEPTTEVPPYITPVPYTEFSPIEDFEYTVNNDGVTVTITKYIGPGGDVVIPAEIEGKSVTMIGDGMFYYCKSLKSVMIPNSVTSIGIGVFYYCNSLKSVMMPNSVTSIGEKAFMFCSSLESVTIPDSVTSIGIDTFYCCSSLINLTIPDSVTSIGESAFDYCKSLPEETRKKISQIRPMMFDDPGSPQP